MSALVSIIIPMYNAEPFIMQTIHSALNQTYKNIELIVMNDGSTDGSEKIVIELQKKDNRIRYQYKPNSGVSDTRNKGILIARGEYIAFLDADDKWKPSNLERKIESLEQTGKQWVFSNLEYIDEKGELLDIPMNNFKPYNIVDNLLLWEGDVVPGPCSNIIVAKEFLGNDIRFDTRLSSPADRDICLQLAVKEEPIYLDEKLWQYRLHAQSMTSINIKVVDEMVWLYKKADEKKWFRNRKLRRKALSNVNLILAGICSRFPTQKKRMFGFLFRSFWFSPSNVIEKRVLLFFKTEKL
jgi:glycosyltransferase involved in cell wall biosynthesis